MSSPLKPLGLPRLNRQLARELGVFGYFPLAERSGKTVRNLAGNQHGTLSSTPPDWVAGSRGPALWGAERGNQGVRIAGGGDFQRDLEDVTLAVRIRPSTVNDGFTPRQLIILGDYGSAWAARLYLDYHGGSTYIVALQVVVSGAGYLASITTYDWRNRDLAVVGVRRGANLYLYVNGVEVATAACPTGILRSHPSDDSSLMNDATPAAMNTYWGAMSEAVFANRAWSAEQAKRWSDQPFALWQRSELVWGPGAAGGAALTQDLSEVLSLTDTRTLGAQKALAEALALTELRSLASGKSLAESLALADSRSLAAGKSLAESLSLTDLRSFAAGKSLAELLSLTEALQTSLSGALSVQLSEALDLTDSRGLAVEKLLAEVLALTDARMLLLAKALADSLALTDTAGAARGLTQTLFETLTLTDSRVLALAKALAEPLVLTDSRALAMSKFLAQSLSLSDTAAAVILTAALILTGRSARGDQTSRTARGDQATRTARGDESTRGGGIA